MAIYHFAAQVISRAAGRSATAAAAYRAGERIHDERTGITFDYGKKSGVEHTEIIAPTHSPEWVKNRSALWNAIEKVEKRKDSQVCREIEVALPVELNHAQQTNLIRDFVKKHFVDGGMIADIAIHRPKKENPHCHILLTMRDIGPEGFGPKNRAWNDKNNIEIWRKKWADYTNKALENAGFDIRIDHRTLEAQGIDRIPQIHIGPKVLEMEKRGIRTERGSQLLDIEHKNQTLSTLKSELETTHHERNYENSTSTQPRTDSRRTRTVGNQLGDTGRPGPEQYQGIRTSEQTPSFGMEHSTERRSESSRESGRNNQPTNNEPTNSNATPTNHHRTITQEPETAAMGNIGDNDFLGHRRSRSIDRIVALAGPTKPAPSTAQHRPERAGRTPQEPLDRSYLAARRQLDAMGAESFEIGIRDTQGRMMLRTWTKAETLAAVPWLKRENAKGADIYVRPATQGQQNAGIVLVDDLNRQALAQMKADGFAPASVTETSPGNFQAWVRLSDQTIPADIATAIAHTLAKQHGGDLNSADWRHFGRLAGFTNQKPIHRDKAGRAPYVLAHESSGQPAAKGQRFVDAFLQQLAQTGQETEKKNRSEWPKKALQAPQTGQPIPDPTQTFQTALKRFLDRFGNDIDPSRADYMAAVDMAKRGYSPQNIAKAIAEASPALQQRKAGHQQDYIDRTVRAAIRDAQQQPTAQTPTRQSDQDLEKDLER